MIGQFLSNSSNQRKIAVALCAVLALFSAKVPFLADVSPEMLMTLIAAIGAWILQSGVKAAAEAHADGQRDAAVIQTTKGADGVYAAVGTGPKSP